MNVIESFPPGAVIGVDTTPFIYHFEAHPEFGGRASAFFNECIDTGRNSAVSSVVTLAEVLTRPKSLGRADLVARYRDYFGRAAGLRLLPIDANVAEQAADLRARHTLRLPDAFQIAASLSAGAGFFLCNDVRLKRVQELKVVLLSELTG